MKPVLVLVVPLVTRPNNMLDAATIGRQTVNGPEARAKASECSTQERSRNSILVRRRISLHG